MHDIAVLTTRPQRDRQAEEVLHQHGVETYRFIEKVRRRRRRRQREAEFRERCLHPRYVFASARDLQRVYAAMREDHDSNRPSIQRVIGGSTSAALDPLRAIDGREVGGDPVFTRPRVGDLVLVRRGPFMGFSLRVVSLWGKSFVGDCYGKQIVVDYENIHPG